MRSVDIRRRGRLMRLFSVSLGVLLAAIGVFFVPVSFAVDGFGLVVPPGGIRTIRAQDTGVVHQFSPSQGDRFVAGDIVAAVTSPDAIADNTLLAQTLRRDYAKIETDHLDKVSTLAAEMDRATAKREATAKRLAARGDLATDTAHVLSSLRAFMDTSTTNIADLNAERLDQLDQLEDLVRRSGDVAALPAQRLAELLDDIQADRLSVINSEGGRFGSDRMILDLVRSLNDLTFSNSVDAAEIDILSKRILDIEQQLQDHDALRASQRAEAEARFLARASVPQVAVAEGSTVDMRRLQDTRADVARGDPLRLLGAEPAQTGVLLVMFGDVTRGSVTLQRGGHTAVLDVPVRVDAAALGAQLDPIDLQIGDVHTDRAVAGAQIVRSVFLAAQGGDMSGVKVVDATAWDDRGMPVPIRGTVLAPDAAALDATQSGFAIVGFLENRHAVILEAGQTVRGSINDVRNGTEIVFSGHLRDREFATVDTRDLGLRLGNQSLATKIVAKGVLSQVIIGLDPASADRVRPLPGAVVQLSFPLARQTLFRFLLAGDAAI